MHTMTTTMHECRHSLTPYTCDGVICISTDAYSLRIKGVSTLDLMTMNDGTAQTSDGILVLSSVDTTPGVVAEWLVYTGHVGRSPPEGMHQPVGVTMWMKFHRHRPEKLVANDSEVLDEIASVMGGRTVQSRRISQISYECRQYLCSQVESRLSSANYSRLIIDYGTGDGQCLSMLFDMLSRVDNEERHIPSVLLIDVELSSKLMRRLKSSPESTAAECTSQPHQMTYGTWWEFGLSQCTRADWRTHSQ